MGEGAVAFRSVEAKLLKLPSYSGELGLDVSKPEDRFKWFLASMLFAKRISAETAKRTYRLFEKAEFTSPERILEAGWDRLVFVLDAGGYVRYDFSTASNLLETMQKLKTEYGDLEGLHRESRDAQDLERRLQAFKGVGPVCVNIFLRELRGIWSKAEPKPSSMAVKVGHQLGVTDYKTFEAALVRLHLEYCKKHLCEECPVRGHCKARQHR